MQRGAKDDEHEEQDDGNGSSRRDFSRRDDEQLTSSSDSIVTSSSGSSSGHFTNQRHQINQTPSFGSSNHYDWRFDRRLNYPQQQPFNFFYRQPLYQNGFRFPYGQVPFSCPFADPHPQRSSSLYNVTTSSTQDLEKYQSTGSMKSRKYLSAAEISSLLNQFRIWRSTKDGKSIDSRLLQRQCQEGKSFRFQLTSYNILSQDLLDYHQCLYVNCSRNNLKWNARFTILTDEMSRLKSSIYCLQEVNEAHFRQDFEPFFYAYGYKTIYKKRPNKNDGCALIYDESQLKLVKFNSVELNQKCIHSSLDRENVALIGLFQPVTSNLLLNDAKVVIATTHLLFNPKRGDIKMNQLRLLLAEISKMSKKSSQNSSSEINRLDAKTYSLNDNHYPVIFCGDFNTIPGSPIHQFLIKGKLDAIGIKSGDLSGQTDGINKGREVSQLTLNLNGIGLDSRYTTSRDDSSTTSDDDDIDTMNDNVQGSNHCHKQEEDKSLTLTHNFKFRSVYSPSDKHNNQLPFISTHHSMASVLVDYIFVSKEENVSNPFKLQCVSYQRLPNEVEIQQIGLLPNEVIGSDHLSLNAQFIITPNE